MKIDYLKWIMAFMILLPYSFITHAQEKSFQVREGWSLNVNGGVSLFYGDVDNYRFYRVFENNNEWRSGFGLMVQKEFVHYFSLRAQGFYGQLSGTKRKSRITFEGDVIETSMSGKFDLVGIIWGPRDRMVTAYAMVGIGLTQWRSELRDTRTNEMVGGNGHYGSGFGGRTLEPVLPVGLGMDVNLARHWTVNLEATLRPVNSDKLDSREGGFRYDFYSYNFIGVTYKFIKDKKEPVMPPVRELAAAEDVPEQAPATRKIKVAAAEPPREKSLEEKLLDAEARTGLYESPWPGVEFAVQVAASRSVSDPDFVREKFGLSGEVNVNQDEGWYRFSVGRFIKYWKAKEYRNILVTRNQISDAFVVAYKEGKRIMLYDLVSMTEFADGTQPQLKEHPAVAKSFSVQVLSSRDGNINISIIREMYDIDLEVYKEFKAARNSYQYTVGDFSSYEEAAEVRDQLKSKGISGAFVVGYRNGVRVEDLNTLMD